jgi:RNA polymerase sigma-70 factor (ECF subfamily)
MNEYSEWLAGTDTAMTEDLDREFEVQLVDFSRLAFRVAYAVVRHREDAEDIAQESLNKAYRSLHMLRERDRFRAWLVRITWRLAIDHQRSAKRRINWEATPDVPSTHDAAETLVLRERSARLWTAIDALPEKLRIVTVLAGIEEHDLRQVGLLLNLPEGTVKSRLFLARQRLRELLS